MKEIRYWLAEDDTKFNTRYDCIEYERRKALEVHENEFQFYNYRKELIPIKEATTEDVAYIVVKSENCIESISEWFYSDGCPSPFNGIDSKFVGTWVYGDIIDKGDEWLKLESEIEKLQILINEVNR